MPRSIGPRSEGATAWCATAGSRASLLGLLLGLAAGAAEPPPLADAVDRVRPAVVRIEAYGPVPAGDRPLEGVLGPRPILPRDRLAVGAGFVYDAPRRRVLTVQHLTEGAATLIVALADGRACAAALLGADPGADLAVLQLPDLALAPAPLGAAGLLRQGDPVFAVGHPYEAFPFTVTHGIVSALGRAFEVGERAYDGLLQTDAPLGEGSSGGPLCNAQGEVVGICVAVYAPARAATGIGFAMPLEDALLAAGHLEREGGLPWLGAVIRDLSAGLASELRLSQAVGVVVQLVVPGGPAAQAGLRARDVVVRVDGTVPASAAALRRQLLGRETGGSVVFELSRDGRPVRVEVKPGRRPAQVVGGW
ncbi:MAG: trypsin-like peptidase domain-containing protein [Armatimonadetes bacterium]|nr:trypsin-like peptidase domain-containing protein [Armatimonadota bacterium]